MSLPETTLPAGLPVFQAANHSIQLAPVYADVAMRTGHSRRRRVVTIAPRRVTVGLFLTSGQLTLFESWFEDVLRAGELPFSARVAAQGPGPLLWWRAEWLDVPVYTPLSPDYWRVTATLLLTGEGSVTGPVSTSAGVEFAARLFATADIPASGAASVEFEAALNTIVLARMEILLELLVVETASYFEREDSGFIEREDGTDLQRE